MSEPTRPVFYLRDSDPAKEKLHAFKGKCQVCRDSHFVTVVITGGNGVASAICTACDAGRVKNARVSAREGDVWCAGFDPDIHKIHPDHPGKAPEVVKVTNFDPNTYDNDYEAYGRGY